MNTEPDIRVQLARMEGKQDVANERLNSALGDIQDIRKTVHSHGDRLGLLEADKNVRDGERKGISISSRVIGWGVSALLGSGVAAAALELLK